MNYGIMGACEPVIRELLDDLDGRERAILENRVLAIGKKQTLQELGNEYSITRERARQVEEFVVGKIKKRALNPLNKSLLRAVQYIQDAVGTACPKEYVFSDSVANGEQASRGTPAHLVLKVLLWLAGPYEHYEGWLVHTPAVEVVGRTRKLIRRIMRREPANLDRVVNSVAGLGIHREWCLMWVSAVEEIRVFGDKIALWDGSLSDKAFAILKVSGRPMSIDDLCREIGGAFSKRTLANYLYAHKSRFRKRGPCMFALKRWGGQEWKPVNDLVHEPIEARRQTICPVTSGHVRLRIGDDSAPKAQDIQRAGRLLSNGMATLLDTSSLSGVREAGHDRLVAIMTRNGCRPVPIHRRKPANKRQVPTKIQPSFR